MYSNCSPSLYSLTDTQRKAQQNTWQNYFLGKQSNVISPHDLLYTNNPGVTVSLVEFLQELLHVHEVEHKTNYIAGKWPRGETSCAVLNTVSRAGCLHRTRPIHLYCEGCWELNDIAGVNDQF